MAENTQPAKCSEREYKAACAAGLLVVTTEDERAIHAFAQAMYADGYRDGVEFVATGAAA